MKRLALLSQLALADLWHDRKISVCIAASLVAVIAPLLLLFGLKYGVVTQLQQSLLNDPRNLEVRMLSSGNFTADWVQQLNQREDVSFAIGMTRALNTVADFRHGRSQFSQNTEVIPTDAGDPVTAGANTGLQNGQILLSTQLARQLKAQVGDAVEMVVQRRLDGQAQQTKMPFVVAAVLEPQAHSRPAAFVAPAVLHDMEWYRDGYSAPLLGALEGAAQPPQQRQFARLRIYAANLDSVGHLEQMLNALNIETVSQLAEIEKVKAINQVLGLIFGVIAATAVLGCMASLAGAFLANVDRKRKDLTVLRLLGFSKTSVGIYIVLQTFLLTVVAYGVGLLLYAAGSHIFNATLVGAQATSGFACQITVWHALTALLLTMVIASAVALIGVWRAVQVQPAESLREI